MSTRAIIGIEKEGGTILGAWQWNDGGDILLKLNSNFNTAEKAMLLINEGMWGSLFTVAEAEAFERWLIDELYKDKPHQLPIHFYVEILGMKLLKEHHHEGRKPEVYADFADAMGQDINYLYLFDRVAGEWKVYT